ncbi:MAG: RDD family protein [Methyloceanibacter sp.]
MTNPQTLPKNGTNFADQPHAYDPVAQPRFFEGVIGKRAVAFVLDAIIVLLLVFLFGLVTFGLGWVLLPALLIVFLVYNAITIGGKNAATLGQRFMGLEVRMWFGGKVSPLVAAFHALLFWFAAGTFVLWFVDVLWAVFDQRKRCLHDILAGVVVINRA